MSDFLDALGDVYSELGFPTPTVSPEPNKNLMANYNIKFRTDGQI